MRRVVIGLSMAVLMAVGSIAPAAPTSKSGLYKGKTSQKGNKISFTIDGKTLTNMSIDIFYVCDDDTEWDIPMFPSDTTLTKKGRFSTAFAGGLGDHVLLTVDGRVKKKGKAKGKADFSAMLLSGAICQADDITWKAKKKS